MIIKIHLKVAAMKNLSESPILYLPDEIHFKVAAMKNLSELSILHLPDEGQQRYCQLADYFPLNCQLLNSSVSH